MNALNVMKDRYVPALTVRTYPLPFDRAFPRVCSTDAHFQACVSPQNVRLSVDALALGFVVTMTALVFDVDGPGHTASDAWMGEEFPKLHAMDTAHPGCFFYATRGGYRIVFALPAPTIITSHDDGRSWKQGYVVHVAYLERRFGILADKSCADWQRLYRLPHATREPGGRPEDRLVVGDPSNIAALRIEPTDDDLARAKELLPSAFADHRVLDFAQCTGDGQGLFFHALRARGSLIRPRGHNGFVIRCPREAEHSCGSTGDGSTVLFLPAVGGELGAIHCKHSHCSHMTVRDWLKIFSFDERDAARAAAGLAPRKVAA